MLISFLKVIKIMRKLSVLHYSLSRLGLPFAEGITIISRVEIRKQRDPHIPPHFKTSTWGLASSQFEFSHFDSVRKKHGPQNSRLCISICSNASMPFSSPNQRIPGAVKKKLVEQRLGYKVDKKSPVSFCPQASCPFHLEDLKNIHGKL